MAALRDLSCGTWRLAQILGIRQDLPVMTEHSEVNKLLLFGFLLRFGGRLSAHGHYRKIIELANQSARFIDYKHEPYYT